MLLFACTAFSAVAPEQANAGAIPISALPTWPATTPIDMTAWCSEEVNFEVAGGHDIRLAFTSRLIVDGHYSPGAVGCGPISISGLTAATYVSRLSSNAALISFKVVNHNPRNHTFGLESHSELILDGDEHLTVRRLDSSMGFSAWSSRRMFTFVGRLSQLVVPVSSFWYGPRDELVTNCMNTIVDESLVVAKGGVAFSWRMIALAGHATMFKSVIMKFGPSVTNVLIIRLEKIPDEVGQGETIAVRGTIESAVPSEVVRIVLIINFDTTSLHELAIGLPVAKRIDAKFTPAQFGVRPGHHVFMFFAIDGKGTVSNGRWFNVSITDATEWPSPTAAQDGGGSNALRTVLIVAGAIVGVMLIVTIVIGVVIAGRTRANLRMGGSASAGNRYTNVQ